MATKATVLKDKDGTSLYPVTDVSLVVGLQEGAIMESVVVSELPTADATTVGTIYMVPSATVTGEYDRYMTTYSNSAYTWTQLGSTAIPSPVIADNLTTNDATQALSAKQGKVLNDNITQLGQKFVIVQYDKTILTKHGYYSKETGEFATTTQNYYSAEFPVDGISSVMLKGQFNSYGLEGCCLFNGDTFVAGLDVKDSYQILQIPNGITKIAVTFVPNEPVSIILSKIKLYNDGEIAFSNATETKIPETVGWVDNKRVAVTGNVGDTATISIGSNTNCKYIMRSVSKGDVFSITARMIAGLTFVILDEDNKIFYKSADSEQFYKHHIVIEQKGTIIVNTNKLYTNEVICYKDYDGQEVDEDITQLQKQVNKVSTSFIKEDQWYINLSGGVGTTAPVDTPTQTSGGYSYSITPVQPTDVVIVNGTSNGGNPRLWAFLDANNVILSVAADQRIVARNLELTAPDDAAFVVINTNEKLTSYVRAVDSLEYTKASKTELSTVEGQLRSDIDANVHDIRRTDDILVVTSNELTKHGKYDIHTGEYSDTTQNFYADEFVVGNAKSLVVKAKRDHYAGECVCLYTDDDVIGIELTSTYQYISLKGVNKVSFTAIPETEFNAILTPAFLMQDVYAETRIGQGIQLSPGRVANNGTVGQQVNFVVAANPTYNYAILDVQEGEVYKLSCTGGGTPRAYCLVDSNNICLEVAGDAETLHDKYLEIKKDGKLSINVNLNYSYEVLKLIPKGEKPLTGKTIALFGDSIMEFKDDSGNGVAEYLHDILGADVIRCSIGGTSLSVRDIHITPVEDITTYAECICYLDLTHMIPKVVEGDMTDINAVWQKLKDDFDYNASPEQELSVYNWNHIDFSKVDIVIVSAGTNDSRYSPLGTDDSTNIHTYNGAVNIITEALLSEYKDLSLFYFTPIVKKAVNGTIWCDDYTADDAGMNGLKLQQVCEGIVSAAERNHIPVCNMFKEMGWTRYNFDSKCIDANHSSSDGVHPYGGFKEIAQKMAAFIVSHLNIK